MCTFTCKIFIVMKSIYFYLTIISWVFNQSAFGQSTYYVSKSLGDDNSGNGSIQYPFKTFGKAIRTMDASDTVIIRRGVYHEAILIDSFMAFSSSPTVIKNYPGETVVIDGTIKIKGQWNDDIENSSIKVLSGISEPVTQLFVGNEQMIMARWPNARFDDESIFDKHNWAKGDPSNSFDGKLFIDESEKDPGKIDLKNCIGILNVGSFKTFNKRITNHTKQSGNDFFEYDGKFGNAFKNKHHYFFFEGKKELLDIQDEWFLDRANQMLYVYPRNGLDLNNTSVRGKVRDYSMLIENCNNLRVEGITFFATTFKADRSDNITIYDCNFYYPSHSRRMLGDLQGAAPTTMGTSGINNSPNRVNNSTIEKCLFINSEGEGIIIKGNKNKVINSYFKNIDWSATQLDGLMVTINFDGVSNEFSGNEIYTTGASATVWPGEKSIFSYNIVSNTGLAQSDGAVFQGTAKTVSNSFVHHNFVYDTEKYAFRYDAPGGDATKAGSFGVMHHNIADNTMGLMIKGNNQVIANNTVINTISNRNDIIILAEDCSNNNTWLYNNLAGRIGSHRSSQSFSLPDDSPLPIDGNVGYIYDSNWRSCQDGDLGTSWVTTKGNGSAEANIDQIDVARPGISYNSGIHSLISYNAQDGKSMDDYTPTSSLLINAGISPDSQIDRPLDSAGNNTRVSLFELVPHKNIKGAPNIGAIDEDHSWTPGINWSPKEDFNIMNMLTLSNSYTEVEAISVYPNPVTNTLTINGLNRKMEYSICDLSGQKICSGLISNNVIDVSNLKAGLYLLRLKNQSIRFIKE